MQPDKPKSEIPRRVRSVQANLVQSSTQDPKEILIFLNNRHKKYFKWRQKIRNPSDLLEQGSGKLQQMLLPILICHVTSVFHMYLLNSHFEQISEKTFTSKQPSLHCALCNAPLLSSSTISIALEVLRYFESEFKEVMGPYKAPNVILCSFRCKLSTCPMIFSSDFPLLSLWSHPEGHKRVSYVFNQYGTVKDSWFFKQTRFKRKYSGNVSHIFKMIVHSIILNDK